MTTITPPPPRPLTQDDERLWATLTHVSGLVGVLVTVGFVGWIGPLVALLVFRDRSAFIAEHAKTALNFQITMLIVGLIAAAMWIVGIGVVVTLAVSVLVIVCSILGAVAANRGQPFTYPLSIPFLR